MINLSDLPFPDQSPHFVDSGGYKGFVFKHPGVYLFEDINQDDTHLRTIICAVAEAWWRRKAEKIDEQKPPENEIGNISWYLRKDSEHEEAHNAADAWAAAGIESA